MEPLTEKARNLIFEYEGIDQPAEWPGGDSGITIGFGYDLGYESLPSFETDWKPLLAPGDFTTLTQVVGLKGTQAKAKAPALKTIKIREDASETVFLNASVPKYQTQTQDAFPGVDKLPADAQGALFSLVYNRGKGMKDSDPAAIQNRLEMRLIRDAVAKGDLAAIAQQLRNMCRLWVWHEDEAEWRAKIPASLPLRILKPPKTAMRGLQRRRIAEAELVEGCIES